MFVLAQIKDVARVMPSHFSETRLKRIELEINKKYANKVIREVGLCILLHDLLEVGDSMIYPGDGAAQVRVSFRMVVFRPLAGEILQGRIRSCSEKGLFVTMGFFEDIVVPPTEMQPDTHFDAKEQLWVWKYGDAELFMEIDEVIHFRVVRGDFHDITPGAAAMGPDGDADPDKELQSPYVLTGSVNDFGLGVASWWE
eukprot:m.77637 g.77637  ORF g.77637 m.77637 type:complete len:198 (-) comp19121_c0_seq1:114-707(-)